MDAYSLLPSAGIEEHKGPDFKLGDPIPRWAKARILRDRVASRYDEATGYAMPGRDGINGGPDMGAIYDDTAVIALPEFASRIQGGTMPFFEHWAGFGAGVLIEDPAERLDLEAKLRQVSAYMLELVNASNFGTEVNESLLDVSLGTGAIRIDDAPGDNPYNSRSIPLRGLLFGIGPDGLPDPIFEERKVELQHIRVIWPGASMPKGWAAMNGSVELTVVEGWERDWSEPEAMRYRMSLFVPELDGQILLQEEHEGAGCCPVIVFRWSKSSGEGWGRGPLFNLLPTLRKVNYAERLLLDHSDMAVAGIWTIEDDGAVNVDTVRLEPGSLVPKAPGSSGLENVTLGANFDIAQFGLDNSRQSIKRALFTEQLGPPEGTPMSATEAQLRMAELARAVGSPFFRILIELVFPAMKRFIYIAKARGLIKLPAIDGKAIKMVSTSPLAQAQNAADLQNIDAFLDLVVKAGGQEAVAVLVDEAKAGPVLAQKLQLPDILRSADDRAKVLARIAAAASEGAENGGTEQAGTTAPGAQGA